MLSHVPLSDLELISNKLPTLQHLDLADSGSRLAYTIRPLPAVALNNQDLFIQSSTSHFTPTYPEFTPTYVDTFFAPLARLPALHTFIFRYLPAKREDTFTASDLSHSLSWRDTATPELRFLQLFYMTLTKGTDGTWSQGDAEYWVRPDDIADFAASM